MYHLNLAARSLARVSCASWFSLREHYRDTVATPPSFVSDLSEVAENTQGFTWTIPAAMTKDALCDKTADLPLVC